MPWLIDSDILIEGERGDPAFVVWLAAQSQVATADIVRAEFLIGVHAVADSAKRLRGERFYRDRIAGLASLPLEAGDYETGARLAGEARRKSKGNPSLVDGLLAAIALRKGATVATKNTKDFGAMNCPCLDPLRSPSARPAS